MHEGKALLDIPNRKISGMPIEVFKSINDTCYIAGFVPKQRFNVLQIDDCDAILVHIPNFFDIELNLATSDWKIEIKPVVNIKDTIRILSLQSGFALTHLAIIKRSDKSRFTFDQAGKILRGLEAFISFIRGAWCGQHLPIGWLDGEITWYCWNRPAVMPWRTTPVYWCMSFDQNELNRSFDKFMNLPEYHELVNVISFYTGANKLEAPDMDVVMTQIALELLVSLYVSTGTHRDDKDIKIRRLLTEKHISQEIPGQLKELSEYCQGKIGNGRPIDGPNAITYLRNLFVHPEKDKLGKIVNVPVTVMAQTANLGLAYIELIVLNSIEYKGPYTDRFAKTTKPIAWSVSSDKIQSVAND